MYMFLGEVFKRVKYMSWPLQKPKMIQEINASDTKKAEEVGRGKMKKRQNIKKKI